MVLGSSRWGRLLPVDLLRYFGVLIWILAAFLLLLLPFLGEEQSQTLPLVGAWSAAFLFLALLWHPVFRSFETSSLLGRGLCLGLLSLSAFAVSYFSASGIGSLLAMVVAAFLPWFAPLMFGVAWVFLMALAFGALVVFIPDGGWLLGLVFAVINLGLVSFPFLASQLALAQVHARRELRRLNSELLATRSLLAENTRVAERVRISRDLHDLVGHHLTALTLNLEVASHTCQGSARDHVDQAASIARLLLSDVREVVNDMRQEDQVDFREVLTMLVGGLPQMAIHLDLPDDGSRIDPQRAQVLLRCAQELLTNAARHSRARNLWITMERERDHVALVVRDDGRGAEDLLPGNGLNGMRERLRELGGRLELSTAAGAGLLARVWLPLGEDG
ncbi:MAG: sensor histidine kinase [Wenzhouxiangella sp.]